MNKKILFTVAPAILLMGSLVGCKGSKEYTVKFDTDGGTAIADVKVKEGSKVARPATNPTKTDYTFDDWYTAKSGNDKFNFDTSIKSDITIYAHYEISKEAFLDVYKAASNNFQASSKEYTTSDVQCVVDNVAKSTASVVYDKETGTNIRTCKIKYSGGTPFLVAGGINFYYDDDPTKGIKAYIASMEQAGIKPIFSINRTTGECGISNGNGGMKYNGNGYITYVKTPNETIQYTYND